MTIDCIIKSEEKKCNGPVLSISNVMYCQNAIGKEVICPYLKHSKYKLYKLCENFELKDKILIDIIQLKPKPYSGYERRK